MSKKVIEMKKHVEKRILFTHTDLDGVGCAVIYSKCFPNTDVFFCDYQEVNEIIMDVLTKTPADVPIMISDLSVDEDTAAYLDMRGNVELIDHHGTAKWLQDKYPWALVDTSWCGTKLMYQVMSRTFMIKDYEPFVELVDNYDRWGNGNGPTEQAKNLSRLVYIMGQERFFHRWITTSSTTLSPTEEIIITLDLEKERRYIEESIPKVVLLTDSNNTPYGLIAADQYVSVLGSELLKIITDIEYIVMIDFRNDKASLRGRGNINLGEFAKQMGGGGHAKAAGFPLQGATYKMFFMGGDK